MLSIGIGWFFGKKVVYFWLVILAIPFVLLFLFFLRDSHGSFEPNIVFVYKLQLDMFWCRAFSIPFALTSFIRFLPWEHVFFISRNGLIMLSTFVMLFLILSQNYNAAKTFVDNWIPRCYRNKTACSVIFEFHQTLASTYNQADKTLPISK